MGASFGGGKTRARRGRSGGTYRPMAEINVTPLVDVMLVLLIVFMVAAPLLTAGVPIDLPNSDAKPITDEENKPIEITLDKDGKIFIGETAVERAKLIGLLSAMTEGQTDRRIYIRGDQSLEYGGIMELLGAVSGAGFTKVALISEAKSR
ncbi:MAG: protein TolR [Alphaproteobacteria bacterium PRO2]|nr:protein TolR [Alphaproteobacteria bacterium PRO2]